MVESPPVLPTGPGTVEAGPVIPGTVDAAPAGHWQIPTRDFKIVSIPNWFD